MVALCGQHAQCGTAIPQHVGAGRRGVKSKWAPLARCRLLMLLGRCQNKGSQRPGCCVQAQQKMAELQGSKLEGLSEITATPTSQLKFITDAWAQARDW